MELGRVGGKVGRRRVGKARLEWMQWLVDYLGI